MLAVSCDGKAPLNWLLPGKKVRITIRLHDNSKKQSKCILKLYWRNGFRIFHINFMQWMLHWSLIKERWSYLLYCSIQDLLSPFIQVMSTFTESIFSKKTTKNIYILCQRWLEEKRYRTYWGTKVKTQEDKENKSLALCCYSIQHVKCLFLYQNIYIFLVKLIHNMHYASRQIHIFV